MKWYIRQDSDYRGPLEEAALLREYERGYVDADTLVSPDPTVWLRFGDYPRLQALVETRGHASIKPKQPPASTSSGSRRAIRSPIQGSVAPPVAPVSSGVPTRRDGPAPFAGGPAAEIDLPPFEDAPAQAPKATQKPSSRGLRIALAALLVLVVAVLGYAAFRFTKLGFQRPKLARYIPADAYFFTEVADVERLRDAYAAPTFLTPHWRSGGLNHLYAQTSLELAALDLPASSHARYRELQWKLAAAAVRRAEALTKQGSIEVTEYSSNQPLQALLDAGFLGDVTRSQGRVVSRHRIHLAADKAATDRTCIWIQDERLHVCGDDAKLVETLVETPALSLAQSSSFEAALAHVFHPQSLLREARLPISTTYLGSSSWPFAGGSYFDGSAEHLVLRSPRRLFDTRPLLFNGTPTVMARPQRPDIGRDLPQGTLVYVAAWTQMSEGDEPEEYLRRLMYLFDGQKMDSEVFAFELSRQGELSSFLVPLVATSEQLAVGLVRDPTVIVPAGTLDPLAGKALTARVRARSVASASGFFAVLVAQLKRYEDRLEQMTVAERYALVEVGPYAGCMAQHERDLVVAFGDRSTARAACDQRLARLGDDQAHQRALERLPSDFPLVAWVDTGGILSSFSTSYLPATSLTRTTVVLSGPERLVATLGVGAKLDEQSVQFFAESTNLQPTMLALSGINWDGLNASLDQARQSRLPEHGRAPAPPRRPGEPGWTSADQPLRNPNDVPPPSMVHAGPRPIPAYRPR